MRSPEKQTDAPQVITRLMGTTKRELRRGHWDNASLTIHVNKGSQQLHPKDSPPDTHTESPIGKPEAWGFGTCRECCLLSKVHTQEDSQAKDHNCRGLHEDREDRCLLATQPFLQGLSPQPAQVTDKKRPGD